jgi:hypothetical protein
MTDRRALLRKSALVLTVILVGYTALWFWEAYRARLMIKRFETAQAAEGITVGQQRVQIGGYPFALEAQIPSFSVTGFTRLPNAKLEAALVTAKARPWRPHDWLLAAPDTISLTIPTESGALRLAAHELKGNMIAASDGGWELRVRAGGLLVEDGAPSISASSLRLHILLPSKPPEEHGADSADFDATLEGLKLPGALGPLGSVVQRIAVDGALNGVLPPQPLAKALAAWRDQGGTIELRHIAVSWQKLSLDGNGTITLDKSMQPLAAFSTVLRGWPAMLDALVAEGAMKKDDANFARIGLSLLARPGPDGESELKTPISLQDGQLYVEKARVARVPRVSWP